VAEELAYHPRRALERVGRGDPSALGRDSLVSTGHSLLEFAVAIDTGFARWDLDHFHMFRLPGGAEYVLGGWENGDDTRVRSRRVSGSSDSQNGTAFEVRLRPGRRVAASMRKS
jgi:hypothetical protein